MVTKLVMLIKFSFAQALDDVNGLVTVGPKCLHMRDRYQKSKNDLVVTNFHVHH